METLEEMRNKMDTVYGRCYDDAKVLNVITGAGSLAEIQNFVTVGS